MLKSINVDITTDTESADGKFEVTMEFDPPLTPTEKNPADPRVLVGYTVLVALGVDFSTMQDTEEGSACV